MLIPLRTDRPLRRRPVITEGLIVINLLVYLVGLVGQFSGELKFETIIEHGRVDPYHLQVWDLISYQFLHDPYGIGHIAFNMLFLWVFGPPVEDRLGRPGFLGFYLFGGVVAALVHAMFERAGVIGASGSIAGVTGAFLALFPRSRIKVLLFFILIGLYQIPSLWFIGFFFAIDLLRQTGELLGAAGSGVAFKAHLAGYVYGFGVGFLLLATGLLKHEDWDIFYLFKQARRRAAFRAASRGQTGGLYESASADTGRRLEKKAPKHEPPAAPDPVQQRRAEIGRCVAEHDIAGAAEQYRALLLDDPDAVFTEDVQLDLGNYFYRQQDHTLAAATYELLLARYPHGAQVGEISLLLGMLYARELERPQRARELIELARERVQDAEQRALADRMLAEISA